MYMKYFQIRDKLLKDIEICSDLLGTTVSLPPDLSHKTHRYICTYIFMYNT